MKTNALLKKVQFFLMAALMLCAFTLRSQTHLPKTMTISTNCYGYYEYLPANYASSTSGFPLIIYSGGAGSFGNGTSTQLPKLLTEGIPYYIKNGQFPASFTVNNQTSSFIVISPQFVNWPKPDDVEKVINFVINQGYKVDQSRIYFTGFSAGGDVAWKYPNSSIARSQRLAAVVPVAGYNYPYIDTGAKNIAAANLPVWALHSNDDGPAPYYWSQNFVNKINSYNPLVAAKITRFNGVTHDNTKLHVYNPNFRDGGYNLYEWMLLYRRNNLPVARAGDDLKITLPVNMVTLNGGASYDPENSPLTYKWSKISGPSQYTLTNATSINASISNLLSGTYDFQLVVTDGYGLSSADVVRVTVNNQNPQIPVANAGADVTLTLPQNSITLNGSASKDEGGMIESYSWSKIAGPAQYTLSNANSINATFSNLSKGTYLFRLQVTDNDGSKAADTVQITVLSLTPNTKPVSNAGNDIIVTLPTTTATLNGSGSIDSDGVITGYLWSQVSGPGIAVINNNRSAITSVSNLQQGLYEFKLAVTDDSSATSEDLLSINVLPAPAVTNRYIKVNLYGGVNAFEQDGWNNWNVTGVTNIISSNFKYSDGANTAVSAVLSYSQGVPDNGTIYGGSMCPPQVLRYTTYSTASTRTLTIRGLNNSLKYDFELFASRLTTGNTTQFVINGVTKSVITDNNKSNKIVFTDIMPTYGQVVVSINKSGTFSYLNGFIITEKSANRQILGIAPAEVLITSNDALDEEYKADGILLSPNPFRTDFTLTINTSASGRVRLLVADLGGKVVRQLEYGHTGGKFLKNISLADLADGVYFLQIRIGNRLYNQKIIKSK